LDDQITMSAGGPSRARRRKHKARPAAANCLHPGFVATGFGQSEGAIFAAMVRLSMVFARRPETGAKTIVHLAASPDVANVTGGYFVDCREAVLSREAQDDAAARHLWQESLRLAGL
jgi:retinol dehydrogenase-12